jgi:putative sterol carrier protein
MAEELNEIAGREQLGELVEGKTDEEINELVSGAGAEQVLGAIFAGMQQAFLPEKAAGQTVQAQFDIQATDRLHSFALSVADGKCEITPGAAESPRVTIGMNLPDYLRMVAGKLDGMQAFMTGKLRLSGDMMFAQTLMTWFGQ